jgi:hypothetical protein
LEVRHRCPLSNVSVEGLPNLDLPDSSRQKLRPHIHDEKKLLNRLIPGRGGEDLPVGSPCRIPDYPGVRFVHSDRDISYKTRERKVSVGLSWNLRSKKVSTEFFLFPVEQAPSSIARNGQDELVVWTERDACHGESVAFEWLTEWPEVSRVVDPNRSVLRSCSLACRREQLAR